MATAASLEALSKLRELNPVFPSKKRLRKKKNT